MNQFDLPHITAEAAITRLAHPLRFIAAQPHIVEQMRQVMGPRTLDALRAAFAQADALTGVAVEAVASLNINMCGSTWRW